MADCRLQSLHQLSLQSKICNLRSEICKLPLTGFPGQHSPIKFRRLVARDAQRLPLAGLEVLGQEHDLSTVVSVVGDLAINGLHYRMRLAANGDGSLEVCVGKRRGS